jgi:hypothetical protein
MVTASNQVLVVEHVITQFWVIPPKITFFSKKNKKKIKQRLAAWRKQAGESSCNFVFILKKKVIFGGITQNWVMTVAPLFTMLTIESLVRDFR